MFELSKASGGRNGAATSTATGVSAGQPHEHRGGDRKHPQADHRGGGPGGAARACPAPAAERGRQARLGRGE